MTCRNSKVKPQLTRRYRSVHLVVVVSRVYEDFLCRDGVNCQGLVEMGENWRRTAIVDVAWYVNSSSFSSEFLT